MAIAFHCQCGKKFTAEQDCAGMRGRCDRCRRKFVVPSPGVEDTMLALTESWEAPAIGSREHTKGATAPVSLPVWRDPIIVFSAGPAVLVLLLFVAFVAGSNFPRESRKQRVQTLTSAVPAAAPAAPAPVRAVEAKQDSRKTITVYAALLGTEFHAAGCLYLKRDESVPMSLLEADAGLKPCSECWPPKLESRSMVAAATPSTPAPVVESVASIGSTGPSMPRSTGSTRSRTVVSREDAVAPSYSGSSSLGTAPTGLQLHMGPRGGIYHYSKNGNKVYQRRKK
jgi:hypothetical protein